MSNALYPALVKGLTYTVLKTPEFATVVQKSPNGSTVRISRQGNPIWHFQLIYDYLYDVWASQQNTQAYAPVTDLQTLLGFFLSRQGMNDDFLFLDTSDYTASGTGPVTLTAFLGNGIWYTPLQRDMGGFLEDVTDLVPGTLQVYAGGVLQTQGAQFTVGGPGLALPGASFRGLYLVWARQPVVATASFQFYFRVRFEEDTQDFERWMAGLWTIGGSSSKSGSGTLRMVSAR